MKKDPQHVKGKTWSQYKSRAETKQRREVGSSFLANVIWQIGCPWLPWLESPCPADSEFSTQNRDDLATSIHNVLEWLDRVSMALVDHHASSEYQAAVQRSGVVKGQSSLSATEQKMRTTLRNARYDMRTAKDLVCRLDTGELSWRKCYRWQKDLVKAYRDGSLHTCLLAAKVNRDTMCRTPSLAKSSAQD